MDTYVTQVALEEKREGQQSQTLQREMPGAISGAPQVAGLKRPLLDTGLNVIPAGGGHPWHG